VFWKGRNIFLLNNMSSNKVVQNSSRVIPRPKIKGCMILVRDYFIILLSRALLLCIAVMQESFLHDRN